MMYNSKLAVALKSAGKVLREFGETVYVPFGSEYSVLIKNLNSVRALVKVEVDGVDVGDGTRFVVDPNSDVELERFIKNGNYKQGNKFKFIERTANIEQNRGVGVEDGIVRIEFNFETKPVTLFRNNWEWDWNNGPHYFSNNDSSDASRGIIGNSVNVNYTADINSVQAGANLTRSFTANDASVKSVEQNEAGITVPGSISNQEFKSANWFPTEAETHVIVLQMLGQTEDNQQVIKPVTVKAKPKCTTCGRVNKATAKFCTECGTSLQIV